MAEAPTVVDNIQKDMLLKASELHNSDVLCAGGTSTFAAAPCASDTCQKGAVGCSPLPTMLLSGLS